MEKSKKVVIILHVIFATLILGVSILFYASKPKTVVVVQMDAMAMKRELIMNADKFLVHVERKRAPEPKKAPEVAKPKRVGDVINGRMTAYTARCEGCSGITASGYDVRGTTHYDDAEYGRVRILAAPKEIPMYSMIRVSGVPGLEPFLAIVLDRGGAIRGTLFDLLCETREEAYAIGRRSGITYEVVRRGKSG